jgi:GTP cyclohydrolase I
MANKIEKINDGSGINEKGYNKIETWDEETINEMASMYKRILELLGEDSEREGLLRTPVRVAQALNYLTVGYNIDPVQILQSAKFKEEYRQMVIVKDIDLYSMLNRWELPSSLKPSICACRYGECRNKTL